MKPEASLRRGSSVEPREIEQESSALFRIAWADGQVCRYDAPRLRRACPCAGCVNEWTGERVLRPESVPDTIEMVDAEIVGRYALTFKWSDGHETGIYSFRYLREICELTEEK